MKFDELFQRVGTELVPTPSGAKYLLSHAREGDAITSVHLTLVRRQDGTYYATFGDYREGYELGRDAHGNLLEFPSEEAACQWAWQHLQEARRSRPARTPEEQARADAESAASTARIKDRLQNSTPTAKAPCLPAPCLPAGPLRPGRSPLPMLRQERAGVEVAVWIGGLQQSHHKVHPAGERSASIHGAWSVPTPW